MKFITGIFLLLLTTTGFAQDPNLDDLAEAVEDYIEDYGLEDPEDILTWAELPRLAQQGEALTLTVTIENAREDEGFDLESVDLTWEFLDGYDVVSISPEPLDADNSMGSLTLYYNRVLEAGETMEVVFDLVAEKPGVHIGDVSIWDKDGSFLYRYVQSKISR
ncbi:MAG: hypothetical protein AAF351_03230 [Pseudomonadota bacterium]